MHHHTHHHHHHAPASLSAVFIVCITLNMAFVLVEAGVGFMYHSLGLLSDASHNLSDVFSLLLSFFAIQMAKRHSNRHFTYGYKKSTILASLINALVLLVVVGAILVESIYKLRNPVDISGEAISWTAGIGILINGATAWLLMKNQKYDLNVKGAFLHMAMDTLVSVGVVISGIIISVTGFVMIDAFISLTIAAIILFSTWGLLKESLYLSIDAVPSDIDQDKIEKALSEVPGIYSWHHLHIWAVSTTENAATLHVVLKDISEMDKIKHLLKEILHHNNIQHITIECETKESSCKEINCC